MLKQCHRNFRPSRDAHISFSVLSTCATKGRCASLVFLFRFSPQELMRDFLEKRDKGQLLIQRSIRLKESLLRPVILAPNTVFKTLLNQV